MIVALTILLLVFSFLLSAYFAGAEMGLYSTNRLRLDIDARRGDRRAKRLARIIHDEDQALYSTLVGTNVSNYLLTASVTLLFSSILGFSAADTELYTVLVVTPLVFVFCEVVPKNIFQGHADRLMPSSAWILHGAMRLLRLVGVTQSLAWLTRASRRLSGDTTASVLSAPKWRVQAMLRDALAGQTHGDERTELVERVFRLSETPLHRVMVPRNAVIGVRADTQRRELVRVARSHGHTVLPVYDARGAHVCGTVVIDDLLRDDTWTTVGERLGPATFLSPHDTLGTALTRLQELGRRLGVVSDQGGRMLGVVTIGDLLREVVGDLSF